MNLLENLLSAGDGGIVKQLAGQFGIAPDQATSAISTLVPALAGGLKEKLASGEGSPSELSRLIMGGSLAKFADDPKSLTSPGALEQGKSLLNMVFGGGDLTTITSSAAEKTGIGSGIVGSMLPIVMTLLAGFLSKNVASGNTSLTDLVGNIAGGGGILAAVKGLAKKVTG